MKIQATKQFSKDLKKQGFCQELVDALYFLTNGEKLPVKFSDHQLKGELKKYRECHIKPDLLLIYCIEDDTLKLIAMDSHANLLNM